MELLSLVDWSIIYSRLSACLLPAHLSLASLHKFCTRKTAVSQSYCSLLFYLFLWLFFWLLPLLRISSRIDYLKNSYASCKTSKCNSSLKPSPIDQERSNYVFPPLFLYRFCLLLFSRQELGMHVVHPGKLVLTLKHCSQPFLSRYILSYLFYMVIILIHIPWHIPVIFFNKPLYCKVFIT